MATFELEGKEAGLSSSIICLLLFISENET